MAWWAIVKLATGEAVSFGTTLADPMPAGLVAIACDHQPGDGEMWSPATRTIVPRPATAPDPLRMAFAAASTIDAKIDIIAVRLGLK